MESAAKKEVAHWTDALTYSPCTDALAWLRTQPDAKTAWEKSERGDWMLYHAGKLAGEPGSDARRPRRIGVRQRMANFLTHPQRAQARR